MSSVEEIVNAVKNCRLVSRQRSSDALRRYQLNQMKGNYLSPSAVAPYASYSAQLTSDIQPGRQMRASMPVSNASTKTRPVKSANAA